MRCTNPLLFHRGPLLTSLFLLLLLSNERIGFSSLPEAEQRVAFKQGKLTIGQFDPSSRSACRRRLSACARTDPRLPRCLICPWQTS